jgi:predicted transcriptional regulator of viral defense system
MKVEKMRRYLPVLLWHVQRRGGRGAVFSVCIRDVCGVDRRCGMAVRKLMMSLVEKGLARQHKQGVYLIKRRAVEEVLTTLRR